MSRLALEALQALQRARLPTPEQEAALEYAIRLFRPAPLVFDREVEALPDESAPTFPAWERFRGGVRPYLPSVGRLEQVVVGDEPVVLGTVFVVAPGVVATNRHVVWQLSSGSDRIRPGAAQVRFRHDWNQVDGDAVEVSRVVAVHPTVDLALLELCDAVNGQEPVRFGKQPFHPGQPVVAVGFPCEDPRDPAFVTLLFRDRYGYKRAAPGEVLGGSGSSFYHDCTTLGGNSGSPLFCMETSDVVGIHVSGQYLYRNEAVPATAGAEFLRQYLPAGLST